MTGGTCGLQRKAVPVSRSLLATLVAAGLAVLAPSMATAAFVGYLNGSGFLVRENSDGTGLTYLSMGIEKPSIADDGSIAYHSFEGFNLGGIATMKCNGSGVQHLTTAETDDQPSYSPDGSRIAFRRFDAVSHSDIWVMNADGSGQTQLTSSPDDDINPAFSPDGTKIAFFRVGFPGGLQVMNADGSDQHTIVEFIGREPSWSPDGTTIAIADQGLWVLDADGSDLEAFLTSPEKRILGTSVHTPDFAPDGQQILYWDDTFRSRLIAPDGSDDHDAGIASIEAAFAPDVCDVPDTTPPTITSPNAGASYTAGQSVTVSFACADDPHGSGLATCEGSVANGSALDTSTGGTFSYTVNATDNAGNEASRTISYTVVAGSTSAAAGAGGTVTTDPGGIGANALVPVQTAVTTPAAGTVSIVSSSNVTTPEPSSYTLLGQQVSIEAPQASTSDPLVVVFTLDAALLAGAGADASTIQIYRTTGAGTTRIGPCDAGSAAASPDPCVASRDTTADGDAVIAIRSSHVSAWNFAMRDPYRFTGFFQPVDNQDASGRYILNVARAGTVIPVRFRLDGGDGLAALAYDSAGRYPRSVEFECDPTLSLDAIEETAGVHASDISYNPSTRQYTYFWKTSSSWAGTCRQLVVKLIDGSSHRADFQFTR
jgi:Bacterial Ig domain/WD40-like Beta Propeller Repeat